ncbi:MAG: ABC transporter permease [Eubacteriales bacterium]|nr:ABC transporter permease [Eubacteriales bacterium]
MNLWENVHLAISSLMANKMRALLTMLGIIIGIGSVIGILTVGDSLSGSISDDIQSLGARNVAVTIQARESDISRAPAFVQALRNGGNAAADKDLITTDMLANLKAAFPGSIEAVSLTETVGIGEVRDGQRYANLTLTGVNADFTVANELTILGGHFLTAEETESFKKVAVVSDKLVDNLFGKQNPLGQTIDVVIEGIADRYTIVGIYEYEESSLNPSMEADADINTSVYIPLNTALHRTGSAGYQSLTLVTTSNTDAVAFAPTVEAFFKFYYDKNPDYVVRAFSLESMADTINDVLGTITIAISLIAAISLLVGGIGVMNIMLVSITERTREIGTRKALGAPNSSIRIQFIVESMIICLIGGAIGIVLGLVLGSVGAYFLESPARASIGNISLAVGFSMAIGIFFGYYPANKAAKLDPIEALRYE